MPPPDPTIRYCSSGTGGSVAWTAIGAGPALVFCRLINHLNELPQIAPIWPFVRAISAGRRLLTYDGSGSGLSERRVAGWSIDRAVDDLAAVVDAAGLETFALYADAAGSQAAIAYAARHPDRVERLVLFAGMARGLTHRGPTPKQLAQRDALYAAALAGWDDAIPTFRMLNAHDALPEATPREQAAFARYTGRVVSGEGFVDFMRTQASADVSVEAARIRCPTLVAQPTRCLRVAFEEGRRLASLVPGARLLEVDTANMFLTASDPSFDAVVATVRAFLDEAGAVAPRNGIGAVLTRRECDVAQWMAQGLGNGEIAVRLELSEKTVRNHITSIFSKLDTPTRAQAIVKARRAGFGGPSGAGEPG
jgi:DNA-binding CsgD family transcriptional regulator/pimeloyl-ACP methyl ester carboxylesterase